MSEEYIKELKNTIKDSGIAGLGYIVLFIFNYISSIIITRNIGANAYGIFSLGRSIILFIISVSLIGLNQGVTKYISNYIGLSNVKAIKGTIYFSFVAVLLSSFFFTILVYIFRGVIAGFFNTTELEEVLKYFIFFIPLINLITIITSYFRGYEKTNYQIFANNIIFPIIKLFSIIIIGYIFSLNLYSVIFSYIFSYILVSIYIIYQYFNKINPLIKYIKPNFRIKELLKFSSPLYLDSFIQNGIQQIPIYIIGYYLLNKYIGIYSICIQLAYILTISLTSFNLVFAPKISRLYVENNKEIIEKIYKNGTKWIFTLSLGLFTIFIIYNNQILSIFGREFIEGGDVLIIVLIGELINVSVGSAGFIIIMTDRPKIALYNSIALIGLTIITGIILVPKYGIIGAGISRTLSIGIINIIRLIEVYHYEKIHPYKLSYIKPIIAALISSLIIIFIINNFLIFSNISNIFIGVLIFAIIYILVIYFLKFEEEEKVLLKSVFNKVGVKIG